ncbi:MAG: rod shape-determining protein MreC, partial [Erythrobacter sp.]|nr:rod shape-determining protein MreC [Erythrobacter sp.]
PAEEALLARHAPRARRFRARRVPVALEDLARSVTMEPKVLDGVEVGMPVRSARGVVGRILEVARGSSRVLLLTDSESVLPVRRATDNTVAFAEGRGDGFLRIRLINLGLNPLEEGDVLVTSGAGGYYRPGVAVAVITELTPDGGIARLMADPSATDFVSVEPIYQPAAVETGQTPQEERIENEDAAN